MDGWCLCLTVRKVSDPSLEKAKIAVWSWYNWCIRCKCFIMHSWDKKISVKHSCPSRQTACYVIWRIQQHHWQTIKALKDHIQPIFDIQSSITPIIKGNMYYLNVLTSPACNSEMSIYFAPIMALNSSKLIWPSLSVSASLIMADKSSSESSSFKEAMTRFNSSRSIKPLPSASNTLHNKDQSSCSCFLACILTWKLP